MNSLTIRGRTYDLPFFWQRIGFCEKAAYLCRINAVRSYEEACSVLKTMRRRKRVNQPVRRDEFVAEMERQKLF